MKKQTFHVCERPDGIKVTAEIASYASGSYSVSVIEQKGRERKSVKSADGLPNEKFAREMLEVFIDSYLQANDL